MSPTPENPRCTPAEVVSRWPASLPLCACISAPAPPAPRSPWSRWSLLASPISVQEIPFSEIDPADPLALLREAIASTRAAPSGVTGKVSCDSSSGGSGGWMVALSYALGRVLEPRAQAADGGGAADDRTAPAMILARYEGALLHDAHTGAWRAIGNTALIPELGASAVEAHFECEELRSRTGREAFIESVRRGVELVHAGDVFQVNLAHRLSGRCEGDPRVLFRACLEGARPWYAGIIETAQRSIVSMSPELYLSFDAATRKVITRPIKGTRPIAEEGALLASNKDRAELVMIVDLMRNDIGRVCDIGSVRVVEPRTIEHHAGIDGAIAHSVATIEGTLRPELDIVDLLAASFPPGSVTGAPKVRAMQIIDAIEPVQRGFYCGTLGYISDDGHAAFNVAIRTATISRRENGNAILDYPVGAGIVADSVPEQEWEETLHKAEAFRSAIARCAPAPIETTP